MKETSKTPLLSRLKPSQKTNILETVKTLQMSGQWIHFRDFFLQARVMQKKSKKKLLHMAMLSSIIIPSIIKY